MANCEFLTGCPFFNDKMDDTRGLGAIYKKTYCQGDNSDCALVDRARRILDGI